MFHICHFPHKIIFLLLYTQYRQVLKQSVVLNNNDAKTVKKVGNNIAKAVERYFQLHPEERRSNTKASGPYTAVFSSVG